MKHGVALAVLLWSFPGVSSGETNRSPLFVTVDLAIGESQRVQLSDGSEANVKLTGLREVRDSVSSAVRAASAMVELNGQRVTVDCSPYHLPIVVAGVKTDCPVVSGYLVNSAGNPWGLEKDARLRLWPADAPLLAPGSFAYPVRQRWFASDTQMANEPVFVDRGECPSTRRIYYHTGLDFGGAEGLVEVVAAADGVVISAGDDMLPDHQGMPVEPRYDAICLRDARDWYYRYSHLKEIDPSVRPGQRVRMGQTIGVIGKEGGSGGWSHLHFAVSSMQPSGRWGTQEAYAFVWEAYRRQYGPQLQAAARPHRVAWAGETVELDGRRSWAASGAITRYAWMFTDGTTASGPVVRRAYDHPGEFSEILTVSDSKGQTSHDFAVVQVMDREHPDWCIPTIHATYAPTLGIRPGTPVTFKVRTFGTTAGEEVWDFGDGTSPVTVHSDGNAVPLNPDGYAVTTHAFVQPGDYLVRVQRTDEHGIPATARLCVRVSSAAP